MNALIPMLVAVLLSETGGRGALFAGQRLTVPILLMSAAIGAAAVGGLLIAPGMTPRARLLLVGIALLFAGAGQFGRVRNTANPRPIWTTALAISRTGVPLLAFAFAAWQAESAGVVAGGVAGFAAAVTLSAALPANRRMRVSRVCGSVLLGAGAVIAASALRLIGHA